MFLNSTTKPKIVLINPTINRWKLYYWYSFFGSTAPPLGLLYIASYLKDRFFDVKILDGGKLNLKEIIHYVSGFKPDLIGITSTTFSFDSAKTIIKKIRKELPESLIVLGGSHASSLPGQSFELLPELNACVVGDGEETFLEIASGENFSKISGLVWKNSEGKIIHNPNRLAENDIDKYALNWNLIDNFPKNYNPSFQTRGKKKAIALVASRGCPYSCSFCASNAIHGRSLRKHSVDYVLDLMSQLSFKYGFKYFYFHDDHFTIDSRWLNSFCKKLIEKEYKFSWACASRVETLSEEALLLLKKAGCRQICVGVESGSDEILAKLNKKTYVQNLLATIRMINKHNIGVMGTFIIGIPGEKLSDLFASYRVILRSNFRHIQVLYFSPLPGSSAYNECPVPPDRWHQLNLLFPVYGNFWDRMKLRVFEFSFYATAYLKRFVIFLLVRRA